MRKKLIKFEELLRYLEIPRRSCTLADRKPFTCYYDADQGIISFVLTSGKLYGKADLKHFKKIVNAYNEIRSVDVKTYDDLFESKGERTVLLTYTLPVIEDCLSKIRSQISDSLI